MFLTYIKFERNLLLGGNHETVAYAFNCVVHFYNIKCKINESLIKNSWLQVVIKPTVLGGKYEHCTSRLTTFGSGNKPIRKDNL